VRPHGGAGGDPVAPAMPTAREACEEARRTTEVRGADYGVSVVGGSPVGAIHGGATRVAGERRRWGGPLVEGDGERHEDESKLVAVAECSEGGRSGLPSGR
jgi:hypothetical protein